MNARTIHMVGIGGIGMSALAQLLLSRGCAVTGSDRDASPVTHMLEEKGIPVAIGHDGCLIPADAELLIYSDSVPSANAERERARQMGLPEMSYFEALGEVSRSARTVAIAGTHGKTTTTAMTAKILSDAGERPTAVVGSIIRDFPGEAGGSNFLEGRDDLFVVEACEYRDHLLKLTPEILVITNIELDHTDYFPDIDALVATFRKAAHAVPAHGVIVTNPSDPRIGRAIEGVAARIADYTHMAIGDVQLFGEFNRDNARAALAAAKAAAPSIELEAGCRSIAAFRGAWRRFEYRGETPSGALVYDDYAHHPTAVRKTIAAARERFPGRRIVVAFHPHTFSRTRSLLNEFASALATADTAIIAPIYPAREPDDPSLTNQVVAEVTARAGGDAYALDSFDAIRDRLLSEPHDALIITMGAGDIYKVAEQIAD